MTAAPIPVWVGANRRAGDDTGVTSTRKKNKPTAVAAKPKLSPKDLPPTVNASTTGTFRPASAKTTPAAAPAKKDAEAPAKKDAAAPAKKTATAKPAAKPKPADKPAQQ